MRLDGDTYEATRAALDALYPGLAAGGYLIVDDYGATAEECRRAVDEFRAEHGIAEPLEQVDWTCVALAARGRDAPIAAAPAPRHRPDRAGAVARPHASRTCRPAASSSSSTSSSMRRAGGRASGARPLRGGAGVQRRSRDDRASAPRSPGRTSTALRRARHPARRGGGLGASTPLPAAGTIFASYNALLDRAAEHDDLEALVLVHQDAEIVDAGLLCAKVRAALARPRRRRRRLRRRDRRAQHRLVGGRR